MQSGPIILIEDDQDDRDIVAEVLKELGIPNELIWFTHTEEAFDYLCTSPDQQFIIICDVNLPGRNGIDLKKQIDADPHLRRKSIPFVYFSTAAERHTVNEVYSNLIVQGYFKKPGSFEETRHTIRLILEYWSICKHPNSA